MWHQIAGVENAAPYSRVGKHVVFVVVVVKCTFMLLLLFCLGGAVVWRPTHQKVTGSTPGRGAIKSTRSTQPSIPLE